MATIRSSTSHEERTASQPRQPIAEPVVVDEIKQINSSIRTIRLQGATPGQSLRTRFLPGQWLDVFIPGLSRAGGFTITSSPFHLHYDAVSGERGYLQIAVQNSSNPPAKWLHQEESQILKTELVVRAGGSFTLPPPPPLDISFTKRLILIGGGVGINPFQSMIEDMYLGSIRHQRWMPKELRVLYATKAVSPINPDEILFMNELNKNISKMRRNRLDDTSTSIEGSAAELDAEFKVFLTGVKPEDIKQSRHLPEKTVAGRITNEDLNEALGNENDREGTLVYVCGPRVMTDTFVEYLGSQKGMTRERVLC